MQQSSEQNRPAESIVIEAIGRQRLIRAVYNGVEMRLAPHQLYSRHGDYFVSAFNAAKAWRSDEERRLGHFKIAGLAGLALTEEGFEPLPGFDNSLPRAGDELVFALLPAAEAA